MSATDVPRYVVFGQPVGHSRSPAIHRAFAAQCGLALRYDRCEVAPAAFAEVARDFFARGGAGANVTLPHKAAALALADVADPAARRAGVANVLTPVAGGLHAHNTDGAGLVRDLHERQRLTLEGRRALLLGAGGAARGVAWNLLDAGLAELLVVNRTERAAAELVARLEDPRATAAPWSALAEAAPFDLVIHATAAGVLGQPLPLPSGLVAAGGLAYDLSYGSAAAPFLAWAARAGVAACDGLGMLVEQAAEAFAIWHGVRPATDPVYAMLRASMPVAASLA